MADNVTIVIIAPSDRRRRTGVIMGFAWAAPHHGHWSTQGWMRALQFSQSLFAALITCSNLNIVLDPNRPYAYLSEREPIRNVLGETTAADVTTVFLTASRCPIGCSMCDLHQYTLPTPTPVGVIPKQIDYATNRLPKSNWIKLYNSGNFFDPASIPQADYQTVAQQCSPYDRVVIENHPRFGRTRHHQFLKLLKGKLEIAVGLETVQPRMLGRLQKQMTRDQFDAYAKELSDLGIDLRVFLIVGSPGLTASESVRWARLSIRHAIYCGARHISLIPARAGNGWGGSAETLPDIKVPLLAELFAAALSDTVSPTCVSVDLWDIQADQLPDEEREQLQRFEAAILHQDASYL